MFKATRVELANHCLTGNFIITILLIPNGIYRRLRINGYIREEIRMFKNHEKWVYTIYGGTK